MPCLLDKILPKNCLMDSLPNNSAVRVSLPNVTKTSDPGFTGFTLLSNSRRMNPWFQKSGKPDPSVIPG